MTKYSYVIDLTKKYLRCGLFLMKTGSKIKTERKQLRSGIDGLMLARKVYLLISAMNEERNIRIDQIGAIGICLPSENEADYQEILDMFECKDTNFDNLLFAFFEKEVPIYKVKKPHITPFSPQRMYRKLVHSVYIVQLGEKVKAGYRNINEIGTGYRSMAGDIGNMTLLDHNNNKITLNDVASSGAICGYVSQLIKSEKSVFQDGRKVNLKNIYNAAQINDPVAVKALDRAVHYLALALTQVALILDPQVFVINSGVTANYQLHEFIVEKYSTLAHEKYKNIPFFVLNGSQNEHFFGMAQYLRRYWYSLDDRFI